MKNNKILKHLTDFANFAIAFSIANFVINFLGIKYEKYLSWDFALTILIGTISILIFNFLVFIIKGRCNKNSKV